MLVVICRRLGNSLWVEGSTTVSLACGAKLLAKVCGQGGDSIATMPRNPEVHTAHAGTFL